MISKKIIKKLRELMPSGKLVQVRPIPIENLGNHKIFKRTRLR